ncbi:MAG: ABC transporter ATP-binding protein [Pelagibacterium sp.]|jgi:branched-chain amino acid transport system ATP-binding protein|uniref:ABC transporter ATP-binding protein n=1 Tax=Pelagibacterium sp. TaxID=1967288 RepID=UPI0032EAF1BF
MSMLEIADIEIARAGIPIVRGTSLVANSGEISVLLGANGAGKTTLLEGISGIIPVSRGKMTLEGKDLSRSNPGVRARSGLAHVEQGRAIFAEMTTEENLKVALNPGAELDEAYALFPELKTRKHIKSGLLSGGEQQMVVIGRALLGRPKVILIDEMSAGLAPVVVGRLMTAVRRLADEGLAVVLVEQFANLALSIGDRAYVLRRGTMVYAGDCDPLRKDAGRLHKLYLGDSGDTAAA